MTPEEKFWGKVTGGDVETCWEWQGYRDRDGYGAFSHDRRPHRAHRYAYESLRAPIPDGLVLDHLCRNRACVNPWHVEPVTNAVNVRRGGSAQRTRCPQGHDYTPENTYRRPGGAKRDCRQCVRSRARAYQQRTLAAQGGRDSGSDKSCAIATKGKQ